MHRLQGSKEAQERRQAVNGILVCTLCGVEEPHPGEGVVVSVCTRCAERFNYPANVIEVPVSEEKQPCSAA